MYNNVQQCTTMYNNVHGNLVAIWWQSGGNLVAFDRLSSVVFVCIMSLPPDVTRRHANWPGILTVMDFIGLDDKRMVNKHKRKISTDTVRRLLLWAHYKFRQHMIAKAREHGKVLLIVNEAYTTKTCCRCGWQHHKLGKKKRFVCRACGLDIDRDVNGSRNILLRNSV
jgi:IS605 OrfB family transposase